MLPKSEQERKAKRFNYLILNKKYDVLTKELYPSLREILLVLYFGKIKNVSKYGRKIGYKTTAPSNTNFKLLQRSGLVKIVKEGRVNNCEITENGKLFVDWIINN